MRVDRLAAALLVAYVLIPTAAAGGRIEAGGVVVTVRTPWPDMLDHGVLPLFVDVENTARDPRGVEIVFTNTFGSRGAVLTKRFALAPGESGSFELFAPVNSTTSSDYQMELRAGGERERLRGQGAVKPPEPGVRNVIVTSGGPPGPGATGSWTSDLSAEAAPRWSAPPAHPMVNPRIYMSTMGVSPAAPPKKVVVATFVPFSDLPRRSEPWQSIDAVVIDPMEGAPEPDQLAAMTAYARTGGVVAFFGASAVRIARGCEEIRPWMEERFLLRRDRGVDTYAFGQGLLLVSETAPPLLRPPQIEQLNAAMESRGQRMSWVPGPRGSRGTDLVVQLPNLELPVRAMALVLILFSVLIGPINMYMVKRSRKPALLLVTVPAIALLFSLLLFAYGALAQGLDLRSQRRTFTLLDQRAHRSSAVEVRHVFAGMSPGMLRPGPGASIWPEIGAGSWDEDRRLVIDASSGVELGGDYMPVRTPVRQTLLTDRAARARVDVRREGDAIVVQNALGTALDAFVYQAVDGQWWKSTARVADGATARLEPCEDLADAGRVDLILPETSPGAGARLFDGSFAARLADCAFVDHMGADPRNVDSTHLLVGILPLSEAP